MGLSAAAAIWVAIDLLSPIAAKRFSDQVYTTQIGNQRHILLADGSAVDLNTDSQLRVHFTDDRRQVTLVRGEAAFKVIHDSGRPFDVQAGKSMVHVLSTTFSVRLRDEARVDVRVTEGRVAISPPPTAVLNAGDAAIVTNGHLAVIREPVDILKRRLLWTQGRLFFNGETLAEAVSEFNRYNHRMLVIADPKMAGLRISGTFSATDPEGFVTTVRALPAARDSDAGAIRLDGKEP